MKTFDTLYKRTKTGAIQYWQISVALATYPTICKESGQLGTDSPIQHREEVSVGKQKRSPMEQAISQAESDWKKKHDEGYKSLSDLGIGHQNGGVHHGLFTIHGGVQVPAKTLEEILDSTLPQFNTDAAGNAKPMLAKAVNWDKVKYPCLVQPKLDGVRCLMVVERDEDETAHKISFLSRSGKPYTTLKHIETAVRLHTHSTGCIGLPFILDGEIYSDEISFQEIIAAVKKQRPDSLKLKFRAYDLIDDAGQTVRYLKAEELVKNIGSDTVVMVETKTASMQSQIKEWHDEWVSQGYEGAMIRHTDGMYGQGQRSSDLLKVKEFDETEFAFKNFEFGQRGVEDLIAVCWTADGEQEFRAKMIGTKAEKEDLYDENDLSEGRSMTIKHFGWTDDGLPRFPIGKAFREY